MSNGGISLEIKACNEIRRKKKVIIEKNRFSMYSEDSINFINLQDKRSFLLKIYFTGGGTAGHVFPALAVCEQWLAQTQQEPKEILWIGSSKGIEKEIVNRFGLSFKSISCGKLRRYFSLQNFFDFFKVGIGFLQCFFFFLFHRPDFLFSKGGFVSVPPCLAAWLLRIPFITHESDLTPGLATKINGRFASKVLTAYETTISKLPKGVPAKAVGNPVRKEIFEGDAAKGREKAQVPAQLPVVLVLGGSLGAEAINLLIEKVAPLLEGKCFFVHQTGAKNYQPFFSASRITFPFFKEEFPDILASADLVVSRSGAGTLWENAAAGKPAILIPLGKGSSRGDQVVNARFFESQRAAVVINQEDCTPERLASQIEQLLSDKMLQQEMRKGLAQIFYKDSASLIVQEIQEIVVQKRASKSRKMKKLNRRENISG